jgi:hypothetical protein
MGVVEQRNLRYQIQNTLALQDHFHSGVDQLFTCRRVAGLGVRFQNPHALIVMTESIGVQILHLGLTVLLLKAARKDTSILFGSYPFNSHAGANLNQFNLASAPLFSDRS